MMKVKQNSFLLVINSRNKLFKKIVGYLIVMSILSVPCAIFIYASNNNLKPANNYLQAFNTVAFATATPKSSLQPTPTASDYSQLKMQLKGYFSRFDGKYGVHFIDLTKGEEFGINDRDKYIAASTVKIPINLYLYSKIRDGLVNPQTKLTYKEQDYEEGTGILQDDPFGNKYTMKKLSELSITYSDNVATNMLLRYLGYQNIKDYMKDLGGKVIDNKKNITSPEDMALYMKKVYEFCQDDGTLGKEFLYNLENTQFNDRLPAKLPKDVLVAHKIGTQIGAIHDIGIVFADKPYILAVMSQNVDEDIAPAVIANISKKVYDYVSTDR